ncbi:hypothetical protein TNCV_223391 [Trichonephila clavipes]|nr:hypothetical protein TNCV_223391 [Trichonephila clavipes]
MVLKATANNRRHLALRHDEFRWPRSGIADPTASVTTIPYKPDVNRRYKVQDEDEMRLRERISAKIFLIASEKKVFSKRFLETHLGNRFDLVLIYTKAFGVGPPTFQPWSSDHNDTYDGPFSPNYHTNGSTLDLDRLHVLQSLPHVGSSAVHDSNHDTPTTSPFP